MGQCEEGRKGPEKISWPPERRWKCCTRSVFIREVKNWLRNPVLCFLVKDKRVKGKKGIESCQTFLNKKICMYTQVKKNVMKFRSTLHGGYYSEHNLLFYQPQVLARMSRLRIFISICSQAYISPVFNKVDNKPFFSFSFSARKVDPTFWSVRSSVHAPFSIQNYRLEVHTKFTKCRQ